MVRDRSRGFKEILTNVVNEYNPLTFFDISSIIFPWEQAILLGSLEVSLP